MYITINCTYGNVHCNVLLIIDLNDKRTVKFRYRCSDTRLWRIYHASQEILLHVILTRTETALNPRARCARARTHTHTYKHTHTWTIARGPINNKSSETSGKRFFTYLRPHSASGRKSNRGFSLGILQYPERGVRISVRSRARARPFQPSNFINVSAAATDVAQWWNGRGTRPRGEGGGRRVADLGAFARRRGASWERLAPHNV